MNEAMDIDVMRRFGGVRRLYGEQGLQRFQAAHVCVVGVGGVGSWAVEALARNAIGRLTLIDLDNIAESNVNRQLHAVEGEFGKAKVTAMAERIRLINPLAQVQEIEDFVSEDNVGTMLNRGYDVVLDAIDDARAKVAMAAWCRRYKVPLIMAGGAGGRFDPTRIRVADLAEVHGDRLLAKVRNSLRRDHGFPKAPQSQKKPAKFGIQCVYSDEPVQLPDASCEVGNDHAVTGLNCAGYGSSVAVTAPCGMAAAAVVLKLLGSMAG
ncbi:tRNA threonylcarbamoyladenosine dehydratase [Methylobacillus caricis]|uniref:tRNA threonylcarbamoyladenosine dehydratase n=1 Tax=Methylobacillus caricis TaxID=1971611 RepID=UPI001CFF67CF|nr:tRNA threonylcarbamoyladenosine dehydratase [Methylobacillus caricis]MCB5186993.1 tRNA threonylcarbamoyladenosine dehydratase [Methylobacillus caricis]